MFKYTLQRIFYMLIVFTIITFMCFVLIRMLPPLPLDPMRPETLVVEARREAMGYNKPYLVQFGIFVNTSDCFFFLRFLHMEKFVKWIFVCYN